MRAWRRTQAEHAGVMHIKTSTLALPRPLFSLRTNELPLEVIVISLSLTLRLLPFELFWSSANAQNQVRGLMYYCNNNIKLTCKMLI